MHTLPVDALHDEPPEIWIGGDRIGNSSAPYIIAEAGVNHDGSLDQARQLIDAACRAGANAVKFQIFRSAELTTPHAAPAAYQAATGSASQRNLLADLELSPDDFQRLADDCRSRGIAFLATPFSVEDLQLAIRLGVPAVKIASTDLDNGPLLHAAADTALPILLSTGASRLDEIDETVSVLDHQEACDRLLVLHCISSYPAAESEAALSTIAMLQHRYQVWTGFSDHTESVDIGGLAVAAQARVLEKHITIDRTRPGPDHAFSLTPDMFAAYVQTAHRAWQILGEPRRDVAESERDVRSSARRSIVARLSIRAGQRITADMLALKRPAGGLEPRELRRLTGMIAITDIPADRQIEWSMVRE